jgi:hypothetical protein
VVDGTIETLAMNVATPKAAPPLPQMPSVFETRGRRRRTHRSTRRRTDSPSRFSDMQNTGHLAGKQPMDNHPNGREVQRRRSNNLHENTVLAGFHSIFTAY